MGSVMVVDESNHAQPRMIRTAEGVGDKWVVASGLQAGERVIIEGLLKAKPGAPIVPEPYALGEDAAVKPNDNKH
jgi:membrane fusion protein (multidrug efflux system)